MYTHKRGRETNIIVEIELGQFLGYQKDSKLKFVTISGKNQTKILVPFAPLPPYHCDFAKNQTNSGEYQQGFLGFFGQKDNRGPPGPLPPTPLIFAKIIYIEGLTYRPEIWHVTP